MNTKWLAEIYEYHEAMCVESSLWLIKDTSRRSLGRWSEINWIHFQLGESVSIHEEVRTTWCYRIIILKSVHIWLGSSIHGEFLWCNLSGFSQLISWVHKGSSYGFEFEIESNIDQTGCFDWEDQCFLEGLGLVAVMSDELHFHLTRKVKHSWTFWSDKNCRRVESMFPSRKPTPCRSQIQRTNNECLYHFLLFG
jgi:hypothetical protein